MPMHRNKQSNTEIAMSEARLWLSERDIYYDYIPPYQIKIGSINFWPGTGTITIDGEARRRPTTGIAGLEKLLVSNGLLRGPS